MKIVKVPEGQTEESFGKVKINNIKETIQMFECISDDAECFDNDTLLGLSMLEFQLWHLLEKFEGKRQ